jgi:hypothetical protein
MGGFGRSKSVVFPAYYGKANMDLWQGSCDLGHSFRKPAFSGDSSRALTLLREKTHRWRR